MSFADEMRRREREKLGPDAPPPRPPGRPLAPRAVGRLANDPNSPADLGRVMTNREKGAAARAEANRRAAELATYAAAPYTIAKALARGPTEQAIGFLTGKAEPDAANAETATPQRRSLGKGSKPASVAPSAADAAAQFVSDRTRALPAGLRRYTGSELGAAVYEGRTQGGQRYFTNRPFENLDGKRRLNVADTGTTYGARTVPGGMFSGPTYERGSIVPPPDEVNGAFEFQLDRSTPAEGLAGRTYPEFSQDDVMPAISETDLRDLSPMQRERFDEAQIEAARGAEYQNAPILAERDELLQEARKTQGEFLASLTPKQRATYLTSTAKAQTEDNRAALAEARENRLERVATENAARNQRKDTEDRTRYAREEANKEPVQFLDTTKLDTSDVGIERLLSEPESAPARAAITRMIDVLADEEADRDDYSQASLLQNLILDDDDNLALRDPNAWFDENWELDPMKLPSNNPDLEEMLRKIGARNRDRGLRR